MNNAEKRKKEITKFLEEYDGQYLALDKKTNQITHCYDMRTCVPCVFNINGEEYDENGDFSCSSNRIKWLMAEKIENKFEPTWEEYYYANLIYALFGKDATIFDDSCFFYIKDGDNVLISDSAISKIFKNKYGRKIFSEFPLEKDFSITDVLKIYTKPE